MTLGPISGSHVFYDPLGRLWGSGTSSPTAYYDSEGGTHMLMQRTASGAIVYRHVFGAWPDEALVWYTGSGTGTRWFYHQDERGSAVALTDSSGSLVSTTVYDEYGATRGAAPLPRFGYTGQYYISGYGLYYYKARIYSPTWGRFLQTDPIGYGDGMNAYNYAHSDPLDLKDPSGLLAAGCRDVPGSRTIDCSAREEARNLVQREFSNWTQAGQDAAVNAIGNYLTGATGFDAVANGLNGLAGIESAIAYNPSITNGSITFSARIIEGGLDDSFVVRQWGVSGATFGVVIQYVTSTLHFADGAVITNVFGEAWKFGQGRFTPIGEDRFQIEFQKNSVTSWTVSADAWFYPNAQIPDSMWPGRVAQSRAAYSAPGHPVIPGQGIGPIHIDFHVGP